MNVMVGRITLSERLFKARGYIVGIRNTDAFHRSAGRLARRQGRSRLSNPGGKDSISWENGWIGLPFDNRVDYQQILVGRLIRLSWVISNG